MADNILAIIPARGGSKRLPGKNIKELNGRPLIAYSVLVAQETFSIGDIAIGTDSLTIMELYEATKSRYCVPLPSGLTTDSSTLTETMRYVCAYGSTKPDWVVLLQPTCPLRQPSLIERWIQEVLHTPNCEGGLTVDKGGFKLGYCDSSGYFTPDYKPMTSKADAKKKWGRENGVFYMFKAENVLKGKPFGKCTRMIPLECPREQSLANIDTQLDWNLTEFLFQRYGYDLMFKHLEFDIHGLKIG